MFEFTSRLARIVMPANDVGVLGIRITIGVEPQLFRKDSRRRTDAAADRGSGSARIKVTRTDGPNLGFA